MTPSFDPITLQVLTSAAYSIAEEMSVALVRTARSTNIKDRRDASCALYTARGEIAVISQSEIGTPLHLVVMGACVGTALAKIPADTLEPGDDLIMNNPYPAGPGHLNDIAIISPIFYQEELVAIVANQAHHVDVGGYAPGSMPFGVWEIYQEGLQIPPILAFRNHALDPTLWRIIAQNIRDPDEVRGDLEAQFAANAVASQRLRELVERDGLEATRTCFQALQDYAERMMRTVVSEIPDGTYAFSDVLEGDGISNRRFRVAVEITVAGEEIRFDFSDTDASARG